MASFFDMLKTMMMCMTLLGIAWVVALSLPKSRMRTVLTEICSWAFLVFCAVYTVSPIDIIPEAALGPVGLVDDLGSVYLGYQAYRSAMAARRERQLDYFD